MLTERGWLGQKTGRGYYRYEDGKRHPDPEVVAMLQREGDATGRAAAQADCRRNLRTLPLRADQ